VTGERMVYVQANASVLGLRPGERAVLPWSMFELAACVQAGLISLIGPDGEVPDPPPVIKRPCGCGGG
jgi:hypothetical protein